VPDGAYGLRFGGDAPRSTLLTATPDDAPEILINRAIGTVELPNIASEDRATVPLIAGGGLELDRRAGTALVTTAHELSDDELAHPYLAPIAAVHSHWLGRAPFHAGGIVVGGLGWGIIGEREAGKSTLLASVHSLGGVVLADDLLVMEDGLVYSGPRTLDLRHQAAGTFPAARSLGLLGARPRWRLDLGPAAFAVPLGGWIILSWSANLTITVDPGAAAAHHIAPARSVTGIALRPQAFLDAAAHPAVIFSRPRAMDALSAGVEALLAELEAIAARRKKAGEP